jgi:eukaryotic-like serine/threonine-protein kinase
MLTGLGQVHTTGLIHLDLKPSNVLFADTGEAMIADFGQSKLLGPSGISAPGPMYMRSIPPEVFATGVASVESDIYQAGLTLYRMFNGEPFYQDEIARTKDLAGALRSGRFPNRSHFMPQVPSGIKRVIRKALKEDPVERYQTAAEMQDALARVGIGNNWQTTLLPAGEVEWAASRVGRATTIFALRQNGAVSWRVELHTERAGNRRALHRAKWRTGLTRAEAFAYLAEVFKELG